MLYGEYGECCANPIYKAGMFGGEFMGMYEETFCHDYEFKFNNWYKHELVPIALRLEKEL